MVPPPQTLPQACLKTRQAGSREEFLALKSSLWCDSTIDPADTGFTEPFKDICSKWSFEMVFSKVQASQKSPERLRQKAQGHMVIINSRVGGNLHQLLKYEKSKMTCHVTSKIWRKGKSGTITIHETSTKSLGKAEETAQQDKTLLNTETKWQSILNHERRRGPTTMEERGWLQPLPTE